MADKPRVKAPKQIKAPKQRTTHAPADPARRRRALYLVGGAGLVLAAVVALVGLFGFGGGPDARAALQDAGCTLEVKTAAPAEHSVTEPGGASDRWNTDPPTNGPHYGQAAIFGAYGEPLEQARVVHNLEHGGVFIQYGEDVAESIVERLRAFYDDHQTGTIMAPLPGLGDQIALGAWVSEGEEGKGYLAKCRSFDEDAFSAFLSAFQFKGPERFDPSQLRPGS
jgi:hypothetical protein